MEIEKKKQSIEHKLQFIYSLSTRKNDAIFPPVYKVIVFAHSQSHRSGWKLLLNRRLAIFWN